MDSTGSVGYTRFLRSGTSRPNLSLERICLSRQSRPRATRSRGEESVRSILAQDYPGALEVVAVDDRSIDHTGEILESLKLEHPSLLSVLRVAELPDDWLGKNYALALGVA